MKNREFTKEEIEEYNRLKSYTMNNKVKYDFFEAMDDIQAISRDKEGKVVVVGTIKKGDAVMRVGVGIVAPNLPTTTMFSLRYDSLLKNNYLKRIEDEKIKLALAEEFSYIIGSLQQELTTAFLTNFDTYYEFLSIPKTIKEQLIKNIKAI